MKIEVDIKVKLGESLEKRVKELGLPGDFEILKKSLDARKRPEFHYRLLFDVSESLTDRLVSEGIAKPHKPVEELKIPSVSKPFKVAVVGSGPAGLFAAYVLAKGGADVTLFERGKVIPEREEDVQRFWIKRELDENSNVQFGEGGAGTFSDGKLTTRVKDKKKHFVYKLFVEHGAPSEILYLSKPHIGTDKLRKVIPSFRKTLEAMGVKFKFSSLVLDVESEKGVKLFYKNLLSGNVLTEEFDEVVLAVGNSARDTFYMLKERGFHIVAKPFAVGVRIIHPQRLINRMQYGKFHEHSDLPPAEYSITARVKERGVFSFCMCPGGVVICSSSERETVVSNGMSNYAREGVMANSAIVVQVFPEDFANDPFKAIEFQKSLERKAFVAAGRNYSMPAQNLIDFLENKETYYRKLPKHGFIPEISSVRLDKLLPDFVTFALKGAFRYWKKRLKFFVSDEATLVGVETRTSSPVKILRDKNYAAVGFHNIYPAGEGAGYAGGITSSAIDGINVAISILEKYV